MLTPWNAPHPLATVLTCLLALSRAQYTGHFKAVVTKPQNVLIMKDVACAGYVAGMNTRWFAKPERGGAMSAEAAQDNIQARLSFGHDDTDRYASMLAFPCLEGQFQSGQLDTVMSVTTRLLPWEVNNAGTHMSFPGGDAMFAKYNAALQLGQVHYGEDMKAAGSRRRLKPCPLATLADRPPACVPLQRTRISSPRVRQTYAQATRPTCLAHSLLTRALPSLVTRTRRASSAPAAGTTRSPSPSCRSSPDKVTLVRTPFRATPAGGGARASRSRPRATAWCRSSSPNTRRWSTRRPKKQRRKPEQRRRQHRPRHQRHPTKCLCPCSCVRVRV